MQRIIAPEINIDGSTVAVDEDLIADHLELTGSCRAETILANFELYLPMFKLVKPKSSDVKSLLGHRARSSAELRVQAQ